MGCSPADAEAALISVYPNPARDYFTVEISGEELMERNITIYNLSGSEIYRKTLYGNLRVETGNWTPGMYIIRVDSELMKIVIQ